MRLLPVVPIVVLLAGVTADVGARRADPPPPVTGLPGGAPADAGARRAAPPPPLTGLAWRSIGPLQGGRSIAVAGSSARPREYYFGATGGGLWKTTDGGTTWNPVTDGQINSSSVGA